MKQKAGRGPGKVFATVEPELGERLQVLLKALESDQTPESFEARIRETARELEARPDLADIFFRDIAARPATFLSRCLPALAGAGLGKGLRKMLKRTAYQLKQKGIELPSAESEQDSQSILRWPGLAPSLGFLSGFDGNGGRMAILLLTKLGGGRLLVVALINADGKLEDFRAVETSKKEGRQLIEELETGSGLDFVEAEAGHLMFVIQEAYNRGSILDRESEKAYGAVMQYVLKTGMIRDEPIIRELFSSEQPPALDHTSLNRLLAIPEIHLFRFQEDRIRNWREELERLEGSVLVLSGVQKREQIKEILQKAVGKLCQAGEKERLCRHLEEMAYYYHLRGLAAEARDLYFYAAYLRDKTEEEAQKPGSLMARLVEETLLPGQEPEGPGREPVEKRTEGGIILPSWISDEGLR
jgi:hypothetical protein